MNKAVKLRCKFEILTPIHIGTGEELDPTNYFVDEEKRKIFKIDLTKLTMNLDKSKIEELKNITKNNKSPNYLDDFRKFLSKINNLENYKVWESHITSSFIGYYKNKVLKITKNRGRIYPIIRSNNKPIIPGSSIKGAIRTAILDSWAKEEKVIIKSRWEQYKKNSRRKPNSAILEKMIIDLDNYNDKNYEDVFKTLAIPDIILENENTYFTLVNIMKIEDEKVTPKEMFPVVREVTNSKIKNFIKDRSCEYDLEIILKPYLIPEHKNIKNKRTIDKKLIVKSLNDYYINALESEMERMFKRKDEMIYNIYRKIKKEIETDKENSALIRLGFGSGFEFMTLTDGFREPEEPVRAKPGRGWGYSKNLVEKECPLGFAVLRFID